MTLRTRTLDEIAVDLLRARFQLRRGETGAALLTWGAARDDLGFVKGLLGVDGRSDAVAAEAAALGRELVAAVAPRAEVAPGDVADVVVKGLQPLLALGVVVTEERLRDRANNIGQAMAALFVIHDRA